MAFPASPLPVVVELDLDGDGTFSTDITSKVYVRDGIGITRGRSNETGTADPSSCALTLNNRDGRFSMRKADGPYFGRLRRNTPLRVSLTSATSWLQVTANTGATPAGGARVTTPDSAGLSITGDLDLRFDADLTSWRGLTADLLGKWTGTAGQKSYELVLQSDGTLGLYWSNNGTAELGVTSTAVVPKMSGRLAVRATLDVDDGAGHYVVRFYTSTSLTGSWTQLGSGLQGGSTTSIFDSTTAVTVLDTATGSQGNVIRGRVYGAQILQGIGGTVRASPDFTAQTHAASSFADAQGNTWTLTGAVQLTTRDVRAAGEVAQWPVAWDKSQRDVVATVEATGVTRRLQAGATRLSSTVYRAMLASAGVVAYWPMEDGSDAANFGSAVGGPPMRIVAGSPSLAAYDGFACSAPIPTLDSATDLRGPVPNHTPTGQSQVRGLVAIPAAGLIDGQEIISVNFTGTANHWQLRYGTGGTITVRCFDEDGTSLVNDGPWGFLLNGKDVLLSLGLTQSGGNINWEVVTWEVAAGTAGLTASGTLNSRTIGRAVRVQWNTNGGIDGMSVGHTVVQTAVTSIFDRGPELQAHVGEAAGDRIARLCEENGLAFQCYGDPADSTLMGPQRPATLVDLMRECETADAGVLFEPRDQVGIAYRTRRSMYALDPTLTLDYTGRHLSSLQPVEDDEATRNDVTVTRDEGASSRAVLETGALSVLPPPDGIGTYETDQTINVVSDAGLPDQAHWRLNVGTADEARYPRIAVNLAARAIATDAAMTAAVRRLDVGDRLAVENPPAGWGPPDDVSQLALGFTEELGAKTHTVTANCTPESPYHVAVNQGSTGAAESRYSAVGTVTAEALDTTETAIDITCPAGHPGWGHDDGDYQIVIGGEVMTVTAVSGTAPSHTLTVTRSVNGIVKSHATGADVALARPVRYGMEG